MAELYETIKQKAFEERIQYPEIPTYITKNLKYALYDWQQEAIENFLTYEELRKKGIYTGPTHLLFNHATGAGKTMLMAAALLYYYKRGYRNFIFFVNQNNIVDKTEKNFIEKTHSKYLFQENIVIDGKVVDIHKVNVFSEASDEIQIKFTTIQKLYNDIHVERENQVFLPDLLNKDIVMLADEAHHLNADTKRKKGETSELDLITEMSDTASEIEVERKGWEHTVIELLLKRNGDQGTNKNALLEFTATIPEGEEVQAKYADKIVHKFGLKDFLSAGYTKEINLISSTLGKKERTLHALLFSWYRYKIALKYDIPNFKPVMLFRSKTIQESREDYKDFMEMVSRLKVADFAFLKQIESKIAAEETAYERGVSRTRDLIEFIKINKISLSEIVQYIKDNYKEDLNVMITNSKDNTAKTKEKTTDDQESLLNNLEDTSNKIRAIFTVDRLTEGWDVLNLFDIVRLYQGQNAGGSNKKTAPATVKEKQLIGRGVRYLPFSFKDLQRNKRKFDEDLNHELRVLEELYYYTHDERSRYISELKNELRKDGYISDEKVVKTFSLKPEFMKTTFYKQAKVYRNNRTENPNRRKKTLREITSALKTSWTVGSFEFHEEELVLDDKAEEVQRLTLKSDATKTLTVKVSEFERHIITKAMHLHSATPTSLLRFENVTQEVEISSIEDLINKKFLGDIEIDIAVRKGMTFADISNQEKLAILMKFFKQFTAALAEDANPYIGTAFEPADFTDVVGEPKVKSVVQDSDSIQIAEELKRESWYVVNDFHGTGEEKALLAYLKETIDNLSEQYKQVYVLRNEEVLKIYDFETGRGFQPDFLLFLEGKNKSFYQVFIEPKGSHLLEKDAWKNDFLKQITKRYSKQQVLKHEGKNYSLIGLPLYNEDASDEFDVEYKKLIK